MDAKIIAALIALFGVVVGALLKSVFDHRRNKDAYTVSAHVEIMKLRHEKLSEIRDALTKFQSIAMLKTPSPHDNPEFYEAGTRIELLIGKDDPDYENINDVMYDMLSTSLIGDKHPYEHNAKFVEICHSILSRFERSVDLELRFNLKEK